MGSIVRLYPPAPIRLFPAQKERLEARVKALEATARFSAIVLLVGSFSAGIFFTCLVLSCYSILPMHPLGWLSLLLSTTGLVISELLALVIPSGA